MKKIIYILFLGISLSQYAPDFDGQKAYEFLLKQCSFGPRYPGSSGHVNFKDYLIKYLNEYSDNIKVMEHDYKHPYENKNIKFSGSCKNSYDFEIAFMIFQEYSDSSVIGMIFLNLD